MLLQRLCEVSLAVFSSMMQKTLAPDQPVRLIEFLRSVMVLHVIKNTFIKAATYAICFHLCFRRNYSRASFFASAPPSISQPPFVFSSVAVAVGRNMAFLSHQTN